MKVVRIALAAVGAAMIIYGAIRLVHGLPPPLLGVFGGWLLAVLIIQFGVLSPLVVAIGAALRGLPDRVRGFVQGGLIVACAVVVIAIPLIVRQFTQPPAKAMLLQDYRLALLVLLLIIAGGTCVAYAIRVARDGRTADPPSGPTSYSS
jgi:hypothetical protein